MDDKKKYTVYGDDERVAKEELDDLSSEVDDILTENTKKKKSKKKQNSKDDGRRTLADELSGEDDDLGDTQEMKVVEEEYEDEEEESEESEEDSEKKPFPKAALIALITILIVVILAVVFIVFKTMTPMEDAEATPTETPIVETDEPVESPEITATPEPTETPSATPEQSELGKLEAVESNHVYSLAETLGFAKDINGATKDYLNAVVTGVSEKQGDMESVNLSEKLQENRTLLERDIKTIETYETMFDSYSGRGYLDASKERLNNVLEFYKGITGEFASATDLVNKANEYIRKENELNGTMKGALKELLDTNDVDYYEKDSQIIYDENQLTTVSE